MARRHFWFEKRQDCHVIYFGKSKIGTITNKGKKILFGDGPIALPNVVVRQQKKETKQSEASKEGTQTLERARQFLKAYNSERKRFFKNKNLSDLKATDPDFRFFIEAAKIVKRLDVTYLKYIQAQVAGLKFANGGRGAFPKPRQLVTPDAETRLADFQNKNVNEQGDEIEVVLSFKEKSMPLNENSKYLALKRKIDEAEATMWEALYVKQCQIARRGKVSEDVETYIEFLKEEMSKDKSQG